MSKITVLITDDSAVVRKLLTEILNNDPDIEVVATASDPYIARDKIKKHHPDVLTLDIEMPRMDGLTFLRNLMRLHPMPVVMISTLTEKGSDATMEALEIGAVDFVCKPQMQHNSQIAEFAEDIIEKVKAAAKARVRPGVDRKTEKLQLKSPNLIKGLTGISSSSIPSRKIIAIGASTGGTEAIREILEALPNNLPGIVIAQHIPPGFSTSFAKRMDSLSRLEVCELTKTTQILKGHAYIAPGDQHMRVVHQNNGYVCVLDSRDRVNRHRPSVDVLFDSVAKNVGKDALGVILTGMGADGVRGLKAMKQQGAHTIAQDEKSSVVWGMPGEAVHQGAVEDQLPLDRIARHLVDYYTK